MPDHNINFLIVEPDPVYQESLQKLVKSAALGRSALVKEVREALVVLSTGIVDFVICDWSDPNGPELGLLKLMKAQEVYKYIPFLVTAVPYAQTLQEAERQRRVAAARGDGYLAKPYTDEGLKKALDEIFARYPSL